MQNQIKIFKKLKNLTYSNLDNIFVRIRHILQSCHEFLQIIFARVKNLSSSREYL